MNCQREDNISPGILFIFQSRATKRLYLPYFAEGEAELVRMTVREGPV